MTKQPKLFHIYKFFLKEGWVSSSYQVARSYKNLITLHPQYADKHQYLIVPAN